MSLGTIATAEDKPVLPWIVMDAPPIGIARGTNQGQGIHENLIRFYEQRLPEYRHVIIYVSIPRLHTMIADPEKNFCVPAMFRLPQQEKFRLYADFNIMASPLTVITVRKNAASINSKDPVSLRSLLDNPALTLGLNKNRSHFGLDPLIQEYQDRENVQVRPIQNQATLFHMLLGGRIDYTLGLAYEVGYIGRLLNEQDTFVSLPIKEAPNLRLAHPNCTRNNWGADIIDRLNDINAHPETHLRAIELTRFWTDAETGARLETAHRKAYRDIYGEELPSSP